MLLLSAPILLVITIAVNETVTVRRVLTARNAVGEPTAVPGGYNETYGYPDGIGGLIVEGPFPYKNGPEVWSPQTPTGAYGLIQAGATRKKDGSCPPIPTDSVFYDDSDVKVVHLTNGLKTCLLGCNISKVNSTGKDPCNKASLKDSSLSNSQMSCFDVGPSFAGGWGICGYNCSAWQSAKHPNLVPCTSQKDISNCSIYCDSRTFP
eukprot:m.344527 g.344527  ORF g.344527 m.344527 type:complete len:207 (-) comp24622_c0_seq1:142-762(-)